MYVRIYTKLCLYRYIYLFISTYMFLCTYVNTYRFGIYIVLCEVWSWREGFVGFGVVRDI